MAKRIKIVVETVFAGSEPDVVEAYFDRLCPFPAKAYGDYHAARSAYAADEPAADVTQESLAVDMGRISRLVLILVDLFDASCLEVTHDGEVVPFEKIAPETKARIVQEVEIGWVSRVKAPGQPSSGI